MKTPVDILAKFEQASSGLNYGTVTLTLSIKQGQCRYIISKDESFLINENDILEPKRTEVTM